jgi:hypothetical protein
MLSNTFKTAKVREEDHDAITDLIKRFPRLTRLDAVTVIRQLAENASAGEQRAVVRRVLKNQPRRGRPPLHPHPSSAVA